MVTPLPKDQVLGAIKLAIANSSLKDLLGGATLNAALMGTWKDMVAGNKLYLGPVWHLFAHHPKFDARTADAPFCQIAKWQDRLGYEVILPEHLAELRVSDVEQIARRCLVPRASLDKVLTGVRRAPSNRDLPSSPSATNRKTGDYAIKPNQRAVSRTESKLGKGVFRLIVICVIGVVAAIILAPTSPMKSVEQEQLYKEFASELPIENAQKRGAELVGTLSDPSWLSLPDGQKKKDLSMALFVAGPKVKAVVINHKNGRFAASIRRETTAGGLEKKVAKFDP